MNKIEYLLTVVSEECAEVAQRASKAIRFGMTEIQPGQPEDNKRRIERELGDLMATAELLGLHVHDEDKAAKIEKLKGYMDYSRRIGTLSGAIGLSMVINEDDGSCPKCGLEAKDYKRGFDSDGGDQEYHFTCRSCGERFTIQRRVIVAEYSVKDKL